MNMSGFNWTPKRTEAAFMLAEGYSVAVTAERIGITERSLYRWKADSEFADEVDRLTLMTGTSTKAERLRIAKRAVRQKTRKDGSLITNKDLLEWMKYAQSETDGAKLDLTTILEATEK